MKKLSLLIVFLCLSATVASAQSAPKLKKVKKIF